jgi:hypothetical protein
MAWVSIPLMPPTVLRRRLRVKATSGDGGPTSVPALMGAIATD